MQIVPCRLSTSAVYATVEDGHAASDDDATGTGYARSEGEGDEHDGGDDTEGKRKRLV
jgi:hypothetical protein